MAPKVSLPVEGQEPHSAPRSPRIQPQTHDPEEQRESLRRKLDARGAAASPQPKAFPKAGPAAAAASSASAAATAPTPKSRAELVSALTAAEQTRRATRPLHEVSVSASESDSEPPPPKKPAPQKPPAAELLPESESAHPSERPEGAAPQEPEVMDVEPDRGATGDHDEDPNEPWRDAQGNRTWWQMPDAQGRRTWWSGERWYDKHGQRVYYDSDGNRLHEGGYRVWYDAEGYKHMDRWDDAESYEKVVEKARPFQSWPSWEEVQRAEGTQQPGSAEPDASDASGRGGARAALRAAPPDGEDAPPCC